MSQPTEEEDTHPNLKARLLDANKKADPIVDRGLDWVRDSPFSAAIVIAVLVAVVLAAKWLL